MEHFDIYIPEIDYIFPMIFVKGTGESSFLFGNQEKTSVQLKDFFISRYPVTQRLWEYITGNIHHTL